MRRATRHEINNATGNIRTIAQVLLMDMQEGFPVSPDELKAKLEQIVRLTDRVHEAVGPDGD